MVIIKLEKLLAQISREFLQKNNIKKYRNKSIAEMNDKQIITACHWWYEEQDLNDEWWKFRDKAEAEYNYCEYLQEFIEDGLCTDIQMIANEYIKSTALPDRYIDKEKALNFCCNCKFKMY